MSMQSTSVNTAELSGQGGDQHSKNKPGGRGVSSGGGGESVGGKREQV